VTMKKIPMRQCIGCRESRPKSELIRIVRSGQPDGSERIKRGERVEGCDESRTVFVDQKVFVDRSGRANGRGAYLCDCLECLRKARKNHGLERAFKINIKDEIYDDLERQLSE